MQDAITIDALELATLFKIVEMGNRLAHGEKSLVRVGNVTLEQYG